MGELAGAVALPGRRYASLILDHPGQALPGSAYRMATARIDCYAGGPSAGSAESQPSRGSRLPTTSATMAVTLSRLP
jgi:hypothetical protein